MIYLCLYFINGLRSGLFGILLLQVFALKRLFANLSENVLKYDCLLWFQLWIISRFNPKWTVLSPCYQTIFIIWLMHAMLSNQWQCVKPFVCVCVMVLFFSFYFVCEGFYMVTIGNLWNSVYFRLLSGMHALSSFRS